MAYTLNLSTLNLNTGISKLETLNTIEMVACINLQDKSTIEYFLKNEKQVTENFGLCPNVTEKTNWKIGGKLNDPPTLII